MKKRERIQINKIINEKGKIPTNMAEMQKTITEYCEQLYASKFNNLEETDEFLETIQPTKSESRRNR